MTFELKSFAHQLADASGAVIQKYFRNVVPEDKADQTLVTIADREAELAIRALIESHRPDDAIWGEEYGEKSGTSGYRWILDPIDGTLPFTAGRPNFATIIGLEHNGKNLLGVIDQPITQERWIGIAGEAAWHNNVQIKTSDKTEMKNALLACTTIERMDETEWGAFTRLRRAAKNVLYGGDAYGYGLLASGWIDVIAETGLKLHDYAGLAPIIEAAGGVITDWQGNSLAGVEKSNVLAAATPELHRAAMALLNQA
ncbi:MAG TPA: inositol monophosphatase family protein [Alphaproteobacteria bacterium]|nr:histidinol phosphate phosphatase [Rhodospirillaceae bacterium]HRJ11778.1 inositol monophosphatase family protein [Alphaproteobacteria bacterium]